MLIRALACVSASLAMGCADAVDPSGADFSITSASPALFGQGDTITIKGSDLKGTVVSTRHADLVSILDHDTVARLVVSDIRLPCTDPPAEAQLEVRKHGRTEKVRLSTRGAPVYLDASVGVPQMFPGTGEVPCDVVLAPGTYGLALFKPMPVRGITDAERTVPAIVSFRMLAHAYVASQATTHTIAIVPLSRRTSFEQPAGFLSNGKQCAGRNHLAGDSLQLIIPARATSQVGEAVWHKVIATSEHFKLLASGVDLPASTQGQATLRSLELAVWPFLRAVYGQLPDHDGDGTLHIALRDFDGAGGRFDPGSQQPNGCAHDLIWIDPLALAASDAMGRFNSVALHEAVHWIDAATAPLGAKPWWSIEGYAVLAQQLWIEQQRGIDFWSQTEDFATCPSCTPAVLAFSRLGYPGLDLVNGTNGASLLRYLLQLTLAEGENPLPAFGMLRARTGSGRLSEVFTWLSGERASEEDLTGLFLLMLYADENIASPRRELRHATYHLPNLADGGFAAAQFPLRAQHIDAGARLNTTSLGLAIPDGTVVELIAQSPGTRLRFQRGHELLRVAALRKR